MEKLLIGNLSIENVFLITILFIMWIYIVICLSKLLRKNKDIKKNKIFYLPEDIGLLETGYIYNNEKLIARNVIALIYEFANQGYLKIEEYFKKATFGKVKRVKFIKIKDYWENFINEKNVKKNTFFNNLFKNRSEVDSKELIKSRFAYKIEEFKMYYKNYNNKYNHITKERKRIFRFSLIFTIIITVIVFAIKGYMLSDKTMVPIVLIFMTGLPFFILVQTVFIYYMIFTKSKCYLILNLLILYPFGIIFPFFTINLFGGIAIDKISLILFIVFNIFLIIILFFGRNMQTINEEENSNYFKVISFRNTLKSMDKNELKKCIKEDTNYYYKMLPYAYTLNIHKIWAKKFKHINIETPDWYKGINSFDKFMSSVMDKIDIDMRTRIVNRRGSTDRIN